MWGFGCGGLGVWQIESVLSSPSSLCLLRTACDPISVVHGVVERSALHPLQGSYLHPPTLIALCALVKTTTTTTTTMMMMRWQWYNNLHPRSLIALCTLDQHCCCCSNITFTASYISSTRSLSSLGTLQYAPWAAQIRYQCITMSTTFTVLFSMLIVYYAQKLSGDGVDYWFNFHNFTSCISEGDGDGWRCYVMETWMEIRQNLIRVLPLPLNGHTLPTWHRWQATSINTFQKIFCIFNTVDKHMLMKRNGLGKSLQKKSKPFEWGLEWEAFWANLSEPGFSRRGFPWNIYPLYKYFYMSRNILDPLFDKSEDLRHLEESWCCQGGCQGIRGVQCQGIWSVLQSLNGGFNTQVLMLVLVVKT